MITDEALDRICNALDGLGTNGALTEMGAIELLAKEVKEGSERIAASLERIAESVSVRD